MVILTLSKLKNITALCLSLNSFILCTSFQESLVTVHCFCLVHTFQAPDRVRLWLLSRPHLYSSCLGEYSWKPLLRFYWNWSVNDMLVGSCAVHLRIWNTARGSKFDLKFFLWPSLEVLFLINPVVCMCDNHCCCWLLLYSAILRSRADSLRPHVIMHEWIVFYSAFLNIHWSGVLTVLAWLVLHETAAISVCSVYTIQPCIMSLHAPYIRCMCI